MSRAVPEAHITKALANGPLTLADLETKLPYGEWCEDRRWLGEVMAKVITAYQIATTRDVAERARLQFSASISTEQGRQAHQSMYKYRDDGRGTLDPSYGAHKDICAACQHLDGGGR